MAQNIPTKLNSTSFQKPIEIKSTTNISTLPTFRKHNIDEAYKTFFASLFKIKDRDVQRRVLQAVNGENVTCAQCAGKIPIINQNIQNKFITCATQTLDKDFEFLERVNNNPKKILQTSTSECLNKIQLGRSKRKFEPYAVKAEDVKSEISLGNSKINYLINNSAADSLLNKIRKPVKIEKSDQSTPSKEFSITEQLLFDNLIDPMSPFNFFNLKSSEQQPTIVNEYLFVSTMEEEMRTASTCNDGGLYPIHSAIISGDLYKLKRQLIIYKYRSWDINIRSEEGKKESPLHYAITYVNNDAINILLDNGANVLATNDSNDTALHYAAEHVRDIKLFQKLLYQINTNDLCKKNDKSQTILHVAAIHKSREVVRLILNFIDEKFNIESVGKDITPDKPGYLKELHLIHTEYIKTFIKENFKKPTIHPRKAEIINQQDGRSGRTALFFAVYNNDVCTSFMLIAHFADTRIPDLSGTTCAMYSTEVLKNRDLALAIYNADSIHNAVVFKTLKQMNRSRYNENRKRVIVDINVNVNDDSDDSDIMRKVTKVFS